MALIEITEQGHGVLLDLKYASPDNFTGRPVYGRAACYLNEEAAGLLEKAIVLAAKRHFRLKIFDAFRPSEAQWALWHHTPDPEFLADPRRGSPHSRGAAVDLTLVDDDGRSLDMGTAFDAFTPRSHHGDSDVSATAQANRIMLLELMTEAGWDFYRNEWWHYQLHDSRRFPVLGDAALPQPMMPLIDPSVP